MISSSLFTCKESNLWRAIWVSTRGTPNSRFW